MSAWRITCFVVAGIFAIFALVQLNDPDPLPWVATYGVTVLLTLVSAFRPVKYGPVVWGAWSLLIAIWLGVSWDGEPNPMGDPSQGLLAEEVVREALGLTLIAVWMAIVSVRVWNLTPVEE